MTLIIFVIVFGGMIFIHEFGHFIVARLFKIPVEEFGFGIPPRAWRFWRNKGHLVIGGKTVVIPSNYDLPFEWQDGLYEEATATVDEMNGVFILRTIELARPEKMIQPDGSKPSVDDLLLKADYQFEDGQAPAPGKPVKVLTPGALTLTGALSDVEPGMEWTINWLPLGGFVRPRGENDPAVPGGLAAVNPWKRLGVLVAGPLMNLLTAVIVFSIIIAQSGMIIPGTVKIGIVSDNSPAQLAGIQEDDIVRSINGIEITEPNQMITVVRSNLDKPISIVLERNGKLVTIMVTPLSSRPVAQGALGVSMGAASRPASTFEVLTGGFVMTGLQAQGLLYLPVGLIQGKISADQARLVGLKGIYDMFGSAIQHDTKSRAAVPVTPPTNGSDQPSNNKIPAQQPTNEVLILIGLLSVSLGIFNLMPIPALDGGRILFTLPEILFRRRIPTRLENTVNGVAFLLLIGLMLFVNVMDFIAPVQIP